jgi:hypothetical protein
MVTKSAGWQNHWKPLRLSLLGDDAREPSQQTPEPHQSDSAQTIILLHAAAASADPPVSSLTYFTSLPKHLRKSATKVYAGEL